LRCEYGIIILIFTALTCVVVVSLIDVSDKFTAGIVSALLAVSPIAIYQALLMFAITICALLVFTDAISNKLQFKLYGKWIIAGAGGSVTYLLINFLIISLTASEVTDYQNLNSLLSASSALSMFDINASVMQLYIVLIKERYLTGFGVIGVIAIISFAALIIIALYVLLKNFKNLNKNSLDKKAKIEFLINTLIAFLSIYGGVISLNILAPLGTIIFHKMMQIQYMLIPIGFVVIIDNFKDKISHTIIKRIAAVAAILLVFTLTVRANVGYTKFHDMSINVYSHYSKVADKISNTEGFKNGMDAVFITYREDYLNNYRPTIGPEGIEAYFRLYEGIDINAFEYDTEKEDEYDKIAENLSKNGVCDTAVIDNVIYIYIEGSVIKAINVTY
jgi:hypothetical protein